MNESSSILIVDDDPHIREVVAFTLRQAGFQVMEASDGSAALLLIRDHAIKLMVLDLMMPEMDGFEVCRRVRQTHKLPIIFLSSRDEDVDRIVGLELGGDDYMGKPFSPRELVARVKAVLRRQTPSPVTPSVKPSQEVIHRGSLRMDFEQWRAFWKEEEVSLTVTEFNLLATLLRAPSKAFNREELIDRVYEGVIVSDRTIDSHIRRLRQKFSAKGGDVIETVHGLGYRLSSK